MAKWGIPKEYWAISIIIAVVILFIILKETEYKETALFVQQQVEINRELLIKEGFDISETPTGREINAYLCEVR